MAKRKQWSEMNRKEKITGIIGILILLFIVGFVVSTSSNTKKVVDNSYGSSKPSQNIDVNTGQPATEAAPQSVTPKVYTGTGDDVVTIAKPADGAAIVTFECPACTENTAVKTNGAESLIVNTIGAYTGSHIIDVKSGSNTSQVIVTAAGSWTLTISGLDKATQVDSQVVSGQGDAVLHVISNTNKAAITNVGTENFAVNVYPSGGGYADLPINTIGSYKGTVPLQGPAYVQVTSDGNWTITPS